MNLLSVHKYRAKVMLDNAHQLNYSMIEKQSLALVWALKHLEVYVGSCFSVFVELPEVEVDEVNPVPTVHGLDIRYIKGEDNILAGALSHAPVGECSF